MSVRISSAALQQIIAAAAASPDAEICGLLFGSERFVERAEPCANVAPDPSHAFEIDPARLIAAYRAMRAGGPRLVGCYHSHPFGAPEPSLRDAAAANPDGWLWAIVADGRLRLYRALAGGPRHGRFEAVSHEIVPTGCATAPASSEGV